MEQSRVALRRWIRHPFVTWGGLRPELSVDQSQGTPDIGFLADDSRHFAVFAQWLYQEWSVPRGESQETRNHQLRQHMQVDSLPLALVAYWYGKPAGIVSLRTQDLQTRPRLTPWLSALYVAPEFRGRGIGRCLVWAAQDVAVWLGYGDLYLFTTDRQGFYSELGWSLMPSTTEELQRSPLPLVFRAPEWGAVAGESA